MSVSDDQSAEGKQPDVGLDDVAIPLGDAIDLPEDVYERIVQQVQQICQSVEETEDSERAVTDQGTIESSPEQIVDEPFEEGKLSASETPVAPQAPRSLEEAGISLSQLVDLILKSIYLNGTLTGFEIAKQLRLPFTVVDEGLGFLKVEHAVEVSSGEIAGRLSYRFSLTDAGRCRAREAFEECRYVGPAPVSLKAYLHQCLLQSTRRVSFTPDEIRHTFQEMVIEESLLNRLGPAILSGQSIFLFGTPGNGKTLIAKAIGALMNRCGGEIYIPFAVTVDRHIITVFDPSLHQAIQDDPSQQEESLTEVLSKDDYDHRWRKIKRPVVMAGGELSLEMLDLRFNASSGYYTAPLHMKSNGGVFLLDDFGRQLVPPAELLNRWILPLEERLDYLTLSTGKKFAIPFEQMILFSTNLNPDELVDAAFLRRIRHKIPIPAPSEKQFREIFRRCCRERSVPYDDWIVSQLMNTHYNRNRLPKSSDPRDLLDIAESICRFKQQRFHLSEEILEKAWQECHGELTVSYSGAED